MKKLIIAALLVILGLFLIKTRAPWNYEITVNGHNAPMTIKVTMVNGKFYGYRRHRHRRPLSPEPLFCDSLGQQLRAGI